MDCGQTEDYFRSWGFEQCRCDIIALPTDALQQKVLIIPMHPCSFSVFGIPDYGAPGAISRKRRERGLSLITKERFCAHLAKHF